jgi:hypothetical protein
MTENQTLQNNSNELPDLAVRCRSPVTAAVVLFNGSLDGKDVHLTKSPAATAPSITDVASVTEVASLTEDYITQSPITEVSESDDMISVSTMGTFDTFCGDKPLAPIRENKKHRQLLTRSKWASLMNSKRRNRSSYKQPEKEDVSGEPEDDFTVYHA